MQLRHSTAAAHPCERCPRLSPPCSYAYDGRRRMRWHVNHHAYGQHWVAGDTIGCGIDLDSGTMRFFRNGVDLVSAGKAGRAGRSAQLTVRGCLAALLPAARLHRIPSHSVRVGVSMGDSAAALAQGEAFANVRRGIPGAAYFAGVSLSYSGGWMIPVVLIHLSGHCAAVNTFLIALVPFHCSTPPLTPS